MERAEVFLLGKWLLSIHNPTLGWQPFKTYDTRAEALKAMRIFKAHPLSFPMTVARNPRVSK